jgi:DNA-binding transcriptional MerR regulator
VSTFTIGQVAERTGFSASALRYYEGVGLLAPTSRTDAGYRLYDDQVLSRLAFIARAKKLGCSLEEITDLVGVWDGERCGPVQRRLHELVTDKLSATHGRIAELNAFASQLQSAATQLDGPAVDGPCSTDCACLSANEPPIACTLQPDAVAGRIERWHAALADVRGRARTPDGRLRLELRSGVDIAELATLVEAEQLCCPFFVFVITIDDRGVALEVGAPAEATELVGAMFGTAA